MTGQTTVDSPPVKKLRILVAESGTREVFDALSSLYPDGSISLALTSVSSASALIPAIQSVNPEVVFVDFRLHPADPMNLIRSIRRAIPNTPLIAMADYADKASAQQSLSVGATDYLLKGHADARLVERVLRAAIERNTVNGLTDLLRDPLTGLYNKDGFSALATRAMQAAQKSSGRILLLTAGIENLNSLQKEFGSNCAERTILDVAALFRGSFRRTDVTARLAAAQFAVLALDALEPTAAIMRQRMQRHLAALNQSRAPWGEIVLQLSTFFWNSANGQPFRELLAIVGSAASLPHSQEIPGFGDGNWFGRAR